MLWHPPLFFRTEKMEKESTTFFLLCTQEIRIIDQRPCFTRMILTRALGGRCPFLCTEDEVEANPGRQLQSPHLTTGPLCPHTKDYFSYGYHHDSSPELQHQGESLCQGQERHSGWETGSLGFCSSTFSIFLCDLDTPHSSPVFYFLYKIGCYEWLPFRED